MWKALLPMGIISALLILAVELEYALHEMASPPVVGSVAKPIYGWLQKYGIRSLLNTPCGNRDDCDVFRQNGIERVLAVNLVDYQKDGHIVADLCVWKPPGESGEWDAAYVNCFFCTSNDSPIGGHAEAAKNIASWPVKYLIVYDTAIHPFNWAAIFESSGWRRIECVKEDGGVVEGGEWSTRCEVWERAT